MNKQTKKQTYPIFSDLSLANLLLISNEAILGTHHKAQNVISRITARNWHLGKVIPIILESYRWKINEFKDARDTECRKRIGLWCIVPLKKEENDTRGKKSVFKRPFCSFIYSSLTQKELRYRQLSKIHFSDFIFIVSQLIKG